MAYSSDSEFIHPFEELSFPYGSIFIDDAIEVNQSWQKCLFYANGEVELSPTDLGVLEEWHFTGQEKKSKSE